ncbi:MAG: tyrosine-type recombinase/integrase [Pseudonocardiaceae bacterium]
MSKEFPTERDAVAHVAQHVASALRFHDLGHFYATWRVPAGVPINIVQTVMGHEQASATLNHHTHTPDDYDLPVLAVFETSADFPPTQDGETAERRKREGRT